MAQCVSDSLMDESFNEMTDTEFDNAIQDAINKDSLKNAAEAFDRSPEFEDACDTSPYTKDSQFEAAYQDYWNSQLGSHDENHGFIKNETESGNGAGYEVQSISPEQGVLNFGNYQLEREAQIAFLSEYHNVETNNPQSIPHSAEANTSIAANVTGFAVVNSSNTEATNLTKVEPKPESATVAAQGHATIPDTAYKLTFKSFEEANAFAPQKWKEPLRDFTVPQTQEHKEAVVKELMQAMYSVEQSKDNEGMVRPWKQGRHSQTRVEIACWKILKACTERHESGPLRHSWDTKDTIRPDALGTFQDRMSTILQILRERKTICKRLLDVPFFLNFIDDPNYQENRVEQNKGLNAKKGMVIKAGKTALEMEEKQSGKTTSVPKKRSRASKPPAVDSETPAGTPKPSKRQRKPSLKTPMPAGSQDPVSMGSNLGPTFSQYSHMYNQGNANPVMPRTPQAYPSPYSENWRQNGVMAPFQSGGHGAAPSGGLPPSPFPTPMSDMVPQTSSPAFNGLAGVEGYTDGTIRGQVSVQQHWHMNGGSLQSKIHPDLHGILHAGHSESMHAFKSPGAGHQQQYPQQQFQDVQYSLPQTGQTSSLQSSNNMQGYEHLLPGQSLLPTQATDMQNETGLYHHSECLLPPFQSPGGNQNSMSPPNTNEGQQPF